MANLQSHKTHNHTNGQREERPKIQINEIINHAQ
jgi:hypothetical protein